jgi:PAT family beta-lactamase induction signal transducer AmpG
MNLLRSRKGRLAAFSGLYLSEGLPQGFAGVALTLEFKRMGMDAAAIGAFAGTILLPWSWKFLVGPLVDNLKLRRFGARKQWIVFAQVGMLAALCTALLCMPQFAAGGVVGLGLFTGLMILHNVFAATQDVAIDALACSILKKDERGLANGIMFGSAQAGQAIGGSGVLALKEWTGSFGIASLLVPLLLTCILTGVLTLIREKPEEEPEDFGTDETALSRARQQVVTYLVIAGKTIFGSSRGILGFLLALLPMGGMALSMVVSTIITPSLGMQDGEIAKLNLVCTAIWVPACLSGGWLSDKFGRRLTLSLSCALSVLPGLWIGWQLKEAGWDHPPRCNRWSLAKGRSLDPALVDRCPCLFRVSRTPLRHQDGVLHGYHQSTNRGNPFHGPHGDVQPRHHLHLHLAGTGPFHRSLELDSLADLHCRLRVRSRLSPHSPFRETSADSLGVNPSLRTLSLVGHSCS